MQPPALSDLTKTKPAEKEGEKRRVVWGWIVELLQFILVREMAGADPRQRVQTEGSRKLSPCLWQQLNWVKLWDFVPL